METPVEVNAKRAYWIKGDEITLARPSVCKVTVKSNQNQRQFYPDPPPAAK